MSAKCIYCGKNVAEGKDYCNKDHENRQAIVIAHSTIARHATQAKTAKQAILTLAFEVWDNNMYRMKFSVDGVELQPTGFREFLMRAGVGRSYAYSLKRFAGDSILREFLPGQIGIRQAEVVLPLRRYYDEPEYRAMLEEIVGLGVKETENVKTRRREELKAQRVIETQTVNPPEDNPPSDIPEALPELASALEIVLRLGDDTLVTQVTKYLQQRMAWVMDGKRVRTQ